MEAIQDLFLVGEKLDCAYKLNGQGLRPKIIFVVLNRFPTPIFPVTMVGNAKPTSYSKIKLSLLINVVPQSTEPPGKGIYPSESKDTRATPKLNSKKDVFVISVLGLVFENKVDSWALMESAKNKTNIKMGSDFFMIVNKLYYECHFYRDLYHCTIGIGIITPSIETAENPI